MDISKFKIPMLTGPNWGQWYDGMQSTTRILHIWDAMRGNLITTTTPHTRDLLVKPSPPAGANVTPAQLTAYEAAKDVWEKKNAQGLGLIQATVSHVIWVKHQTLSTAKEVLDALEAEFGKVGGAQTYLQLVNMVKIQFANLMDLLQQIQAFQDNYNQIGRASCRERVCR